jgi:hypothetical protein
MSHVLNRSGQFQAAQTTILAIIFGASKWPDLPMLGSSNAFTISAARMYNYLTDRAGLNLVPSFVKCLFDSKLTRDQLDLEIRSFLERHYVDGIPSFTDVIIYYTGHGDFTKGEQHFQVLLRSSNEKIEDFAGYTMRQLAATVNAAARKARKFVFLDCCYAAAAFSDWQRQGLQDPRRAIEFQAQEHFPDSQEITGTVLFCACDERQWALFKDDQPTMFSGSLLNALVSGDNERGKHLSVEDIYELTKEDILRQYGSEAVAPLLHVPKGQSEILTSYPLFPNPAYAVSLTKSLKAYFRSFSRSYSPSSQRPAAESTTDNQQTQLSRPTDSPANNGQMRPRGRRPWDRVGLTKKQWDQLPFDPFKIYFKARRNLKIARWCLVILTVFTIVATDKQWPDENSLHYSYLDEVRTLRIDDGLVIALILLLLVYWTYRRIWHSHYRSVREVSEFVSREVVEEITRNEYLNYILRWPIFYVGRLAFSRGTITLWLLGLSSVAAILINMFMGPGPP